MIVFPPFHHPVLMSGEGFRHVSAHPSPSCSGGSSGAWGDERRKPHELKGKEVSKGNP